MTFSLVLPNILFLTHGICAVAAGYWNIIVHGRKHSYRLYTKMLNEAMRWANAIQGAIDSKVPIETPTQQLIRDIKVLNLSWFPVYCDVQSLGINIALHFFKMYQICVLIKVLLLSHANLRQEHSVVKWGICAHQVCCCISSFSSFQFAASDHLCAPGFLTLFRFISLTVFTSAVFLMDSSEYVLLLKYSKMCWSGFAYFQESSLNVEAVEQTYWRNPILRYTQHPLHSPLLPLPYGDVSIHRKCCPLLLNFCLFF